MCYKSIPGDKSNIVIFNLGNVSGLSTKQGHNEKFLVQPTKREKEYLDIYSFKQKLNKTISMKSFNAQSFADTTMNQ